MNEIEKLQEAIKKDDAFLSQLKGMKSYREGAVKLIGEYAVKHGFDTEEMDEDQLGAVAGGNVAGEKAAEIVMQYFFDGLVNNMTGRKGFQDGAGRGTGRQM